MSRASSLYRLQQLDLELDENRSRVKEINALLEDDAVIARHRQALSETNEQLKIARAANLKAEHAVATQRSKIERTEKTLYGGVVKDPKELQDRQQEAESLKRYMATLEDRLLEVMIHLEEAQSVQASADDSLANAQQSQNAHHKDLTQERDRLTANISRMEAEREAALANVEQQDLKLYDNLRKQAGGIAIALLQEGNCSACGLGLAQSIQQSIRSGSELIKCGQCSRVLYAG
jgi:predicted  nucleic acid-binding Zn-ribbon protein